MEAAFLPSTSAFPEVEGHLMVWEEHLIRMLITSVEPRPQDLLTSQRPHLLTPSSWGLGFNM